MQEAIIVLLIVGGLSTAAMFVVQEHVCRNPQKYQDK